MFTITNSLGSLVLPDQEIGNVVEYNPRLNIKFSMDGTPWTTKRTPIIHNRSVTFRAVRLPEVNTLKTMLVNVKDELWTFTGIDNFTGYIQNEVTFEQTNFECPEFDFTLEIQ